MKKSFLFIVSGLFILSISSCKKDNKSCNVEVATISGSYKTTAAKYKASSSVPEIDGMSFLFTDDCEKDDVIALNANGTYVITDAGMQCDPVGGDSGNWSLSGNTITIDGDAATVSSFDCTNMIVVIDNVFNAGDKLTVTYTKQ